MLTIRPKPCSYMCGSAAWTSRNGASSITARSSRNFSGGNSWTGATCCRPAQFTRTSACPASAAASKSAARSTSKARPPMRPATASAASTLMSATTTAAPAPASRMAQASPMPLAPPVTTASRPASSALIWYLPSMIVGKGVPEMAPFCTGSWCRGEVAGGGVALGDYGAAEPASPLPAQVYPHGLARVPERLYPPPAGQRVDLAGHRAGPVAAEQRERMPAAELVPHPLELRRVTDQTVVPEQRDQLAVGMSSRSVWLASRTRY